MSTRATYEFGKRGREHTNTYYIHCDNYPSGAAGNLRCLLEGVDDNYNTAELLFIRNNQAELTRNWLAHGDTEYHYYIEQIKPYAPDSQITIWINAFELERDYSDGKINAKQFFTGQLSDFIEKFGENSQNEDKKNMKYRILIEETLSKVVEVLAETSEDAVEYIENHYCEKIIMLDHSNQTDVTIKDITKD